MIVPNGKLNEKPPCGGRYGSEHSEQCQTIEHGGPVIRRMRHFDPKAESACSEVLALPIYPELTVEQLNYVADSVLEFLES